MKIKYTLEDPDADKSLALVDELVKAGVITDRDSQILGIYDDEIVLEDVYPSDQLTEILALYPGYKIFTDPSETDAFKPEEGLTDLDKIGTVNDPNYKVDDQTNQDNDLSTIKLFPEPELKLFSSEGSGRVYKNINFNKIMRNRRNFNDPALDPNGVAKDGQQAAVEAEAKKDDANYTPAEGSFSSTDVEPFSQAEIDKANNVEVEVNGNEEVKVFSEEEIENMTDPDEIEETAEEMENEETTFSAKKKRLFAAKRRLRRINSIRANRRSFAEELTEKEQSDVIEDIVAILNDAPEIRDAVADEVDELSPSVEETTVEETTTASDEPEVTEETTTEETVEDPEVTTEAEDPVEKTVEETTTEETPEGEETETIDEDYDADHTGEVFCKTFSNDNVKNYRRQVLAQMAAQTPRSRR